MKNLKIFSHLTIIFMLIVTGVLLKTDTSYIITDFGDNLNGLYWWNWLIHSSNLREILENHTTLISAPLGQEIYGFSIIFTILPRLFLFLITTILPINLGFNVFIILSYFAMSYAIYKVVILTIETRKNIVIFLSLILPISSYFLFLKLINHPTYLLMVTYVTIYFYLSLKSHPKLSNWKLIFIGCISLLYLFIDPYFLQIYFLCTLASIMNLLMFRLVKVKSHAKVYLSNLLKINLIVFPFFAALGIMTKLNSRSGSLMYQLASRYPEEFRVYNFNWSGYLNPNYDLRFDELSGNFVGFTIIFTVLFSLLIFTRVINDLIRRKLFYQDFLLIKMIPALTLLLSSVIYGSYYQLNSEIQNLFFFIDNFNSFFPEIRFRNRSIFIILLIVIIIFTTIVSSLNSQKATLVIAIITILWIIDVTKVSTHIKKYSFNAGKFEVYTFMKEVSSKNDLILDLADTGVDDSEMYFQTIHNRKMINSQSKSDILISSSDKILDKDFFCFLNSVGAKYVVWHGSKSEYSQLVNSPLNALIIKSDNNELVYNKTFPRSFIERPISLLLQIPNFGFQDYKHLVPNKGVEQINNNLFLAYRLTMKESLFYISDQLGRKVSTQVVEFMYSPLTENDAISIIVNGDLYEKKNINSPERILISGINIKTISIISDKLYKPIDLFPDSTDRRELGGMISEIRISEKCRLM
jgi:hypothetical protein